MAARYARPKWRWFTAKDPNPVMRVLINLRPNRIVVGNETLNTIAVAEREKLIVQLTSYYEKQIHVYSRLAAVFRELTR